METIVQNTNAYVQYSVWQKKLIKPDYTEHFWTDTYLLEMKAYFGIAILFGVLNQPRYKNYWSKNPYLGNVAVQNVMTLQRYQKISEYLHVSDQETELPQGHPQYDKLGKPRWLITHMQEKYPEFKHPDTHQTIDEGVCAFTGRCGFLQYNNMKLVSRGIKLYIHACLESGYCQAFNIYLGADSTEPSKNGATFDVVWNLVEVLQNKYYCIFFDNLYTSIPLLRFMYSKGLYGCGTVWKLRKFLPPYVKDPGKKMKR